MRIMAVVFVKQPCVLSQGYLNSRTRHRWKQDMHMYNTEMVNTVSFA